MPTSISESLSELSKDSVLIGFLGEPLVKHYLAMKQAEHEMLTGMSARARKKWLIERY